MTDYEKYEKAVKKEQEKNEKYIIEFEKWLTDKGLTKKTIYKHISNIDLYLNNFLNYYEATSMEEGINEVSSFLGDWFIRKCMWSSRNSIKENASTIKKFYQCMSEMGHVKKEYYKLLCEEIKDEMEIYLENLDDYDNGTYFKIF